MKDNFLDSILFILVVAIAGLLFQLLSLHKDFKVYVDIFIQVLSFVGGVLAIYEFIFKNKKQ
ncbi:MAG: hypothetical protein KBF93_18470 [Leptospiraceae bacterium]|nr:hypothetical protein [Leptospiraceae bacterium]